MWTTFWFHILRGQHKELYFDLKTLTDRLEEIIPKILPIIVFFYIPNDLPVPKIASYYSQCDHLYWSCLKVFSNIHIMTVFALGVPRVLVWWVWP